MHFELVLVWLALPFASYLLCRFLIAHAERLGMLDPPSRRSAHSVPIPRLGGLGFVPVFGMYAAWVLVHLPNQAAVAAPPIPVWIAILLSTGALFVLGALDDYRDVPAKVRLLVQSVLVVVVLWVLSPKFAAYQIKWPLWTLCALVLILAAVWWVNLFNFMDGADGFAGSQALWVVGAGAIAVGLVGADAGNNLEVLNTYVNLSVGLFLVLLGFLALNWSPAKLFMGDSGSTALAFYLFFSSLLVCLIDWRFTGFFLCLVAYFVCDATVTLLARIARRANVFKPHREHAYQVLLSHLGGSHARLSVYLWAWNVLVMLPLGVWSLHLAPLQLHSFDASAFLPTILPVLMAYGASIAGVVYIRVTLKKS